MRWRKQHLPLRRVLSLPFGLVAGMLDVDDGAGELCALILLPATGSSLATGAWCRLLNYTFARSSSSSRAHHVAVYSMQPVSAPSPARLPLLPTATFARAGIYAATTHRAHYRACMP